MSERAYLGVAIVGALLVAASALGVTAFTVGWLSWSPTAGFATAWPSVEIASTPYTRVGLVAGAVLLGFGFALFAALRPPRKLPGRPAWTCPHHDSHVGAGRVYSSTSPDATAILPAGRWVGHAPIPPARGVADHTLQLRPYAEKSHGRLVAGGAEGSPPATHERRSLGVAPRAERPAVTPGGGMSERATAGRHLLPQPPPTWTARSVRGAAGLDEINHT